MRRSIVFLLGTALAAVAITLALHLAQKTSNAAVTALLPRDTVAFVHFPDFNQTRSDWKRSDIFQLYAEPAVQEFLRKPLAKIPDGNSFSDTTRQIEQLDPKDAFVALTSMANDVPKIVGGFRFRGSEDAAEAILAKWRAELVGQSPRHEAQDYQQHKIDIYTGAPLTIATVYDGHWFFAANDLAELKALLDRADNHAQDRQSSLLAADENFRAATAEMPANYALGFYVQPKIFAEKLAALRSAIGQSIAPNQRTMLEQIRSICATTRFDNGKIHDVIFVGMPKFEEDSILKRDSIALGTKDTFLYLASLLNFSKQLALLDPSAGSGILGGGLSKIADALAKARITMDDWKSAFGPELEAFADWPASAHWPSGIVAFPVKDEQRAKKIAGVLARASDDDAVWKEIDRNGVHYITMQSAPGFLVLRPTIAVSNRVMIVGPDPGSVESAIARSGGSASELARSPTYKTAASSLPAPENFFAYVDLALLYSRLDATLRPILIMGAAFMPSVNDYVDLGKVPPVEVVTKHLSPIVSSQRYKNDGYITESIGPITLNQSGIALLFLAGAGYRSGWADTLSGLGAPSLFGPSSAISPAPSPAWSGKGFKVPNISSPSPTPKRTP